MKEVIMPALGMAQETGTLLQWLKRPGEAVTRGEPLMEVETDKATVEVEAPASGTLSNVTAQPGDVVPVGQAIALILAPGEAAPAGESARERAGDAPALAAARERVEVTPLAARLAAEHRVNPGQIKPQGGRVRKEDVLAYLAARQTAPADGQAARVLASPKARRLAQERGVDLQTLAGSGPMGAVLAADVPAGPAPSAEAEPEPARQAETVSRIWQVMAERVTQAWTTIPHFYLLREMNAGRIVAWREALLARSAAKVSHTDLLVKVVAAALREHPRLNGSWQGGSVALNPEINIGLAVAVDDGLVVPVIHQADQLGVSRIAARRAEIVGRAQKGKLTPQDLSGGTFTISNLGMYGVDAFNAIVNPPQAAILAVGRIAERVVALGGQPAVQPMIVMSLSCDHRVVDGATGARFLQTLAELVEEPMRLLE